MHELLLIGMIAIVTLFTRAIPFLLFENKTSPLVTYLAHVLSYAIMAMLVIYCLKSIDLLSGNHKSYKCYYSSFVEEE